MPVVSCFGFVALLLRFSPLFLDIVCWLVLVFLVLVLLLLLCLFPVCLRVKGVIGSQRHQLVRFTCTLTVKAVFDGGPFWAHQHMRNGHVFAVFVVSCPSFAVFIVCLRLLVFALICVLLLMLIICVVLFLLALLFLVLFCRCYVCRCFCWFVVFAVLLLDNEQQQTTHELNRTTQATHKPSVN